MSVRGASPTELRRRAGRDPKRTLVAKSALGAALVCLTAVVALALIVSFDPRSGIDIRFHLQLFDRNESGLFEIAEDVVEKLGSRVGSLALVLGVGAGWLARRDARPGLLLATAVTGTGATAAVIKSIVGRVSPLHEAQGASAGHAYPSAHSAAIVAVVGTLLLVITLATRNRRLWFTLAVVISALVVATMAAALMSHGYHWFTDIVGGVFTAGIWVCGLTFPAYVLWTDPKLSSVLGSVRSRPACRL